MRLAKRLHSVAPYVKLSLANVCESNVAPSRRSMQALVETRVEAHKFARRSNSPAASSMQLFAQNLADGAFRQVVGEFNDGRALVSG